MIEIFTNTITDAYLYYALKNEQPDCFYKIVSQDRIVDNKIYLDPTVKEFIGFEVYNTSNSVLNGSSKGSYKVISKDSKGYETIEEGDINSNVILFNSLKPLNKSLFLEINNICGPVKIKYTIKK